MSVYKILNLDTDSVNKSVSQWYNWYHEASNWNPVYKLHVNSDYKKLSIHESSFSLHSLGGTSGRDIYNITSFITKNDMLDMLSYGVKLSTNNFQYLDRVGNDRLHQELPIQNGMKGCIIKIVDGNPIVQYYLDPEDWRRKKTNMLETINVTIVENDGIYTITNDIFSTLKYEHQWFFLDNTDPIKVISIDTTTKTATVDMSELGVTGDYTLTMGSILNGYDGEVMVEIPEFWIKNCSGEVRISSYNIDGTWEHQPKMYISAYHDTVLNAVPEDMGYLSTLPVNSAISVCNTNTYCRGGSNNLNYDKYLSTDVYKTMLGKPRTNLSRANMRTFARNAGKEVMNYDQYKRTLYWLYIIEYADLNIQHGYTSTLDGGKHQGGLGAGVTNLDWNYVKIYNYCTPIVPNGTTNTIGNNTGIVTAEISLATSEIGTDTETYIIEIPRWRGIENPFGDINTMLEGILVKPSEFVSQTLGAESNTYYITENPDYYSDSDYNKMVTKGISQNTSNYITDINGQSQESIEIIPLHSSAISGSVYFGDYATVNTTSLSTVTIGGNSYAGDKAGLLCWNSTIDPTQGKYDVGFRTVCEVK